MRSTLSGLCLGYEEGLLHGNEAIERERERCCYYYYY